MQPHGKIAFKKLTKNDIPLLSKWFSHLYVNRWWPILKQDEVIDHFLKILLDLFFTVIKNQLGIFNIIT